MSKSFDNLNDLFDYLKKEVKDSMDVVGEKVQKKVKDNIDKYIYSVYPNPKIYKRTGNLKNAITKSNAEIKGNEIEVEVFVDDNIAQSYHMYNPNNDLEPYAKIVETGIGYDFDYPYAYNQPRPFMGKTKEEIGNNEVYKKELKKSLESKGLVVK